MPTSLPQADGLDPETPLSVLSRFAITTLTQDMADYTVVAQMPVGGMRNPFTGLPTVAGLAILVDDVAGRVNYYRRGRGVWTVSSELTVEMSPGAVEHLLAAPEEPVVASARPLGPAGATLLSICTLTHRGTVIGGGTVRTMPLAGGPDGPPDRGEDPLVRTPQTTLAELMAVEPLPVHDGVYRLRQHPDPMINNLIGIVHGGVSSAGLELAAAAAFNHEQDAALRTASIRINFIRPFIAGAQSVYEATALRIGRTSAIADATAIGDDGKAAVIARVTGYR
ncbi:MAG: PaaI family thioesterase [Actinobacteria bacterium]|nr:PaaI family thioesterase [Actinomycetota bacterium]